MMDLLDINVWLALVDENHAHHAAANRFWDQEMAEQAAFCRVSMLGFMRLCTQPRVLSRRLTHDEAWAIYRRYLALPEIRFLAEPESTERHFADLTTGNATPHHLWTDAYLAAFAVAANCRLVSFDRDFRRFDGLDFLHLAPLSNP